MFDIQLILALVSFAVTVVLTLKHRSPRGLQLPPGPRPRLLIGNALDIPFSRQWLTFERWAREYGEYPTLHSLCISKATLQAKSSILVSLGSLSSY